MRTPLLVVAAAVLVGGCGEAPDPASSAPAPQLSEATVTAAMEKWSRSCVLCHINGEGGAPRVGHPEEWAERLEQGEEVLLTNTVEGLNNMPPLGYCMDCDADDFRAMIRFMAGDS